MPTTIPFDPSLVLGQIVDNQKLNALMELEDAEKGVEIAETNLNSLLQAKLSLDTTLFQVKSLGVEVSQKMIEDKEKLNQRIVTAASELIDAKLTAYGPDGLVSGAQKKVDGIINSSEESPIDFERSQIKRLPLSSDSIVFDSQYFTFDKNDQSSQSSVASIKSFISATVSFLGTKRSTEFSAAVAQQASAQQEKHDVIGTLVITAKTTHEDAKIISPMILDVDKAVRVWNAINEDDTIVEDNLVEMLKILQKEPDKNNNINILSGMTLGSSFVGMVHVLRSASTDTSQRMQSVSSSLQAQMKAGGWFTHMEGGFGVNSTFADDVKKLLSAQEILSHCSLVSVGIIPTIRSNQIQIGVKEFAEFDPAAMMGKLATLANTTTRETNSLDVSAEAARTGQRMVSIRGAEIESVMSSLGKIDDGANQILDINSLMVAFEDYVNKASQGEVGVPLSFYVKTMTKVELAQNWLDENYPDGPPDISDVNETS